MPAILGKHLPGLLDMGWAGDEKTFLFFLLK
jgi:hypothetical protein